MNKHSLYLSPNYCSDWSVGDALREIFQNALDDKSTFQYGYNNGELMVTSVGVELPLKTLLLGNTTKGGDKDSVGGFGEGYKIAILVLLRQGLEVTIKNGSKLWTPFMEYREDFDSEMLCIEEEPLFNNNDLTFIVSGLSDSDWEEAVERCLYLQEDLGEVLEGSSGRVLLEREGKLYVGGLYVSDTNMQYSYDFNPHVLKLNRDRKAVDSWDLKWNTATLWNEVADNSKVAKMMFENCPDVKLAGYTNSKLKDSCFKIYEENFAGKAIAYDLWDKECLEGEGYKDVLVIGNQEFVESVRGSSEYNSQSFEMVEEEVEESPIEILRNLLDNIEGDLYDRDLPNVVDKLEEMYNLFNKKGVVWG